MNYFALSALVNIITSGVVGFFVLSRNYRSCVNRALFYYAFSIILWSGCYFFWQIATFENDALFWTKALMFFAIFIPSTFLQLSTALIGQSIQYRKQIFLSYAISVFFAVIDCSTNLIVNDVRSRMIFDYWPTAGEAYIPFLVFFFVIVIYAHILMYRRYKRLRGVERDKIKYVFLGTAIAFSGGSTNYFLWFDIPILPLGNVFVSVYVVLVAYAIIRYRLMDIRIAVTRAGIFVVVYSLVLGIPFWIGAKLFGIGLWLIPTGICAILATAGPSIYLYLQRKAEYKILQKEKDAEQLLRQTSEGMLAIHDLQKVMDLIVDLVVKILHFKMASVYLWDETVAQYVLKASNLSQENKGAINSDDILIEHLKSKGSPLVFEEIKMMVGEGKDNPLYSVLARMEAISGHAIIPIMRNELLGFLVLGERHQQTILSQDLLGVLTILCNQSALAIENAMYYEESQKDWTQRAHDSRLRTMGAMGTGIAHQIRNRLNAISTQCLLLQDLLDSFDPAKATPEDFCKLRDERKKVLEQIFKNIKQGEEIVESIKNYAKQTEANPQVVTFEQAVSGAMYLLKLSRKNVEFILKENYPKDLKLWTNFSMLQDMLYNMLDNSNDAIISKKQEMKEGRHTSAGEEFRVNLNTSINGKMCEISFEDNGIGIKREHLEEDRGVNVMYFTTKGAVKGTGMGLALMRQFIRHNGGTMRVESEYTQWTKITFTLPLATEKQIQKSQDNNGQGGL